MSNLKKIVKVIEGYRVTISQEVRSLLDLEIGDLLLETCDPTKHQVTFTQLNVQPKGGTLTW